MRRRAKIVILSTLLLAAMEVTFLCLCIFAKCNSGPKKINDFNIVVGQPNEELWLATGYSDTQWNISTTKINVDADVTYEIADGHNSNIQLINGSMVNVVSGLGDDEYAFTLIATATYKTLKPKVVEGTFVLDVDNGTFNNFTVSNAGGEDTYGFSGSLTSNTTTTTVSPVPDSLTYTLTEVTVPPSTTSSILTINSSSGIVTLANGAPAGDYTYKVRATAVKQHHNDKMVTSDLNTISIGKATFPNFTIQGNEDIGYDFVEGYAGTNATLSLSTTMPANTTITYSVLNSDAGDKLTITDGNKLTLSTGLTADTYSYKISALVTNPNYTNKTVVTDFSTFYVTKFLNLAMTSNDLPTPYHASASSQDSNSYAAWKAFDNVTANNDTWCCSANLIVGSWLAIDFGSPKTVTDYDLKGGKEARYYVPTLWEIQCSDDGNTWSDSIHDGSSSTTQPTLESFHLEKDKIGSHRYYRVYIYNSADPWTPKQWVEISELYWYCANS